MAELKGRVLEFARARRGEGASWPQISTELGIAIEQLLRVVRAQCEELPALKGSLYLV